MLGNMQYEKDGNLAFSLYEFLLDNISSDKNNLENAKRIGKAALIGALKSINIVEKIAKEVEKEIGKEERTDSLYRKVSEFEKNFNEIIEEFYKKNNKCLLVFIDDLDRCDPENVLNLLSSIKLLLTFGGKDLLDQNVSKVIYFCGIDKDAVTKAANIQFHDKIKAEEYLEKLFDISFNMPKRYKTENIVKKYFKNNFIHIAEFLNYINFL